MTTQAQMFPLTEEERIARIRTALAKDEEKAKTKRDTALVALDEATESWTMASAMLTTFDEMTGVVAACRAALAVPEGVDAETGEVTSPQVLVDEVILGAEGAAGHVQVTAPSVDNTIGVAWPGAALCTPVEVGANTRFSNLVSQYLASLEADDPHKNDDLADYAVFEAGTEMPRDLKAVIPLEDHGREFAVVPIGATDDF